MDEEELYGFNGYTLAMLSERISIIVGLSPIKRENSYWGEYYRFEATDEDDHFLIWNEIPFGFTDPDEAAEPEFLDWKCLFYVAYNHESPELRAALLAIDGAKLLREKRPLSPANG